MVNGVITDQNGNFSIKNLRYGKYIVKFSFIGYRDVFKNVEIKSTNLDLGTIELRTASEILEGIEIVAERQMMEYKLDDVEQPTKERVQNAQAILEIEKYDGYKK
jgi:hypothetical protein